METGHSTTSARRESLPSGGRRGYVWLALTVLGLLASIVLGDAVATGLGIDEQGPAPPGEGALVLIVTMPLVLLPVLGAWLSTARHRGSGETRLPIIIASVLAVSFIVMNVLGWLVQVAAWAVNML